METHAGSERGTALLVALFAAVLMVLIGTLHLMMSGTESEIASNETAALQARYAAESAAQVVRLWFERPGSAPAFPDAARVVRAREILDPTDPYGADPLAGGPQYKQDTDLDGDGVDDLFAWPYTGASRDAFLGTEEAPDMRVQDAAALLALSAVAFGEFPDAATGVRAVVRRVDVRAPPYVRSGGGWRPNGTATIDVLAAIERDRAGSVETLAERRATLVLEAVPYAAGVFGALHACGDAEIRGTHGVGWGALVVSGAVAADTTPPVSEGPPRALPGPAGEDRLWTDDAAWVAAYSAALDPTAEIADPWVRLLAGGTIVGAPSGATQPWADPTVPPSLGASPPWNCCDGSNVFQTLGPGACPDVRYGAWKRVARSGGRGTRYLIWDGSGRWLDEFGGSARTFDEIFSEAGGAPGVWFFDTADARAPRDDDGDGRADNLTPPLEIGPGWRARGFVYLNAERLVIRGLADALQETLRAPGEPFVGAQAGWIDLAYPDDLLSPFGPGAPGSWERRGPEIVAPVAFRGVLADPGDLEIGSGGTLYGALVGRSVLLDGTSGPSARVLRDATLAAGWPPVGWGIPRFTVLQQRLE
jgi:hypothetical protein